jgi:hypothetical protein
VAQIQRFKFKHVMRLCMTIGSYARTAVAAVVVAVALGGCVVTATPYGYYAGPAIAVAPPPPQVDAVVGVAPGPGFFWIGGYWDWVGGRHVWVGGHWQAPRAGYRWEPHAWVHGADGWHAHPGHWVAR